MNLAHRTIAPVYPHAQATAATGDRDLAIHVRWAVGKALKDEPTRRAIFLDMQGVLRAPFCGLPIADDHIGKLASDLRVRH
jgi:hypothetical protein